MIERDQRPVVAEANNTERFVLANHREAEHLLIKIDGTLQVRDLNADMIDIRVSEIELLLSGAGGRSARSQHRETSNQFSAAHRALLEVGQKIGNDRLHAGSLSL